MTPPRILIIDDDAEIASLVAATAEHSGIDCIVTTDADAFFAALTPDISVIFLDLVMPDIDGVEMLRILGSQMCTVPIVLMSGVGARVLETAVSLARSLGLTVKGHLRKPFRIAELEAFFEPVAESKKEAANEMRDVVLHDNEFHRALLRNEFVLHYQPQIEIATGEVVGVEALVRWQHPVHGLIYPDSFITRCEGLELINELGMIVAARALSEIATLSVEGSKPLMISINVSAFSLLDLSLPDILFGLARKHNKNPGEVVLEITETGLIRDLSQTLDVLTRLRMKGFQLSVDDFGTGYAMMQQLRDIPATEIKIDRAFVSNIDRPGDRVMVHKIIEMGHELGLKVIAEGVETAGHLEALRECGCDLAQGYFFSKPLPPAEFTQWLANYRSVPAQ
jgi:EAL domain-containing protein (putative c-di-GMP-specific phosphodiesterase class I)/FixJ family two-component response regulator